MRSMRRWQKAFGTICVYCIALLPDEHGQNPGMPPQSNRVGYQENAEVGARMADTQLPVYAEERTYQLRVSKSLL